MNKGAFPHVGETMYHQVMENGLNVFVFPKPEFQKFYPALVVELKWNKDVKTALDQIKDRKYPDSVACYAGELLMVGINYNEKTKEHECRIEKYGKH